MKNKKNLLSVLLTAVLLCALVCGVLIFGADAEGTNKVYVVTGTTQNTVAADYAVTEAAGTEEGTGNLTFETVIDAITYASTQPWGAEDTLEIQIDAATYTVAGLTDTNLIFSTAGDAIWRGEGENISPLPITIAPHASQTEGVTIQWSVAGNLYTGAFLTFENMALDFSAAGAVHTIYCAGNIEFNNVTITATSGSIINANGYLASNYPFKSKAQFDALKAYDEYAKKDLYTSKITFSGETTVPSTFVPRATAACDASFGTTIAFGDGDVLRADLGGKVHVTGKTTVNSGMYATRDKTANIRYGTLLIDGESTVSGIVGIYGASLTNSTDSKNSVYTTILDGGTVSSFVGDTGYTARGILNLVYKSGTITGGKIEGCYAGSTINGDLNVIIDGDCKYSAYGVGKATVSKTGHSCVELKSGTFSGSSCLAVGNANATVNSGGKAGVKISKDLTSTEAAKVFALYAGKVTGEAYIELAKGTVEGQFGLLRAKSGGWTTGANADISLYFNGGTYSTDNCVVFGKDYTAATYDGLNAGTTLRMEWNGTIPFDNETTDNDPAVKENYRHFSPISAAKIPCNAEMVITSLNTEAMNTTETESGYKVGRLERWVLGTTYISGDLTLIIDLTEDGLKLADDGVTRAADDSDVNKAGSVFKVRNFQDWGTVYVGGHSKTYINGGENYAKTGDDEIFTLGEFHAVAGTQVTIDARNIKTTGQFGICRGGNQFQVAEDSAYAIQDFSVTLKNADIGAGFYATKHSYTSTNSNVYGTLSVSIENSTIHGDTQLNTPGCSAVNPEGITIKDTDMGGVVSLYKGKLILDGSQVHIPTATSYKAGTICLADGTELEIKENCGKFRYGIGKVPQEALSTVGGDITIYGGENYGFSTAKAAAGGVVGNVIKIYGGNFERTVQGNDVTISGGNFGVSATGVAVSGAKVTLSGGNFNWSSSVSGDSVTLAGGTIYMTGADAAHKIEATEITAETKIVRKSADHGNAIVDGRVYVSLPDTVNPDLLTFDDAGVSGYWMKEEEGGKLVIKGHRIHTYEASLVITNRVAINFIFNKAEIEHALANSTKALTYTFTTPYGDVDGTLSAENYDAEKGTYVVSLEAVGAKDFDSNFKFDGAIFTDKSFSINAIATAGAAVEGTPAELVTLYKALLDYGAAAEGTLTEQTAGVVVNTTDIPTNLGGAHGENGQVFTNKTLLMGDAIGIRLFASEDASAMTVKLYGEDVTAKTVRGTESVDIYVNALNLNDTLEITIYDGETLVLTLRDTVKNIANQLAVQEPTNLKALSTLALIQAIQNYTAPKA